MTVSDQLSGQYCRFKNSNRVDSNAGHSRRIRTLCAVPLLIVFIFAIFISAAFIPISAASASPESESFSTYLNDSDSDSVPNGAVFVIVDGLGSYYLFPELNGETLDGDSTAKAFVPTLTDIWKNGFRVSEMKVPVPVTEMGHSVLVTGNPSADSELVGYSESTVMDILRQEGFLCIGVMQRGDFESMRGKFDVIIYDKTNSVNNMDFTVQVNSFNGSDQRIVNDLASVFESQRKIASSYTDTKDTGEKYAGYNRWGLDTAYEALSVMEKYPNQKFILVINVGAIDSTGHYRGYYAYLDAVEKLDADLKKLFDKCRRSNLFFLFTADHGMSFETQDKKGGGHSSAKYAKTQETLHIPFIIYGNTVQKGIVYDSPAAQEDVAPTLMSLFNIPESPRFSKGNVLPAKTKPALYVQAPGPVQIQLYRSTGGTEEIVFNSLGFSRNTGFSDYSVAGVDAGNYILRWESTDSHSYQQEELTIAITADTSVDLSDYLKKQISLFSDSDGSKNDSGDSFIPSKLVKPICFLLAGIINLTGAFFIYRFYKKGGLSGFD
ncbi:2,3-bisphosphoglycerate-independent phosphoglycerate mutase [Methanimicrococcus sp. At1]|uniref:2,3-bisphosphoglycerate-independent phosphoglycerate mutase n=1 Tax=Methanimicrococcus hacksteinii TaxID=3028293 RepID=A0ABU3VMR9_9EURY|nr:sulfatase-like hydrolase/transferase [Methanimicrococcus sp. At1]MDV0444697.1 2,3-bisphosphoglycerate-independent phosphoglycerate mutase [Methanimicrococcus sp. At1]